ncbi:ABC transporter permease [Apilactobacillus quenuiae]|uniref:ABC transporter permease n=1 Tax=Apilactobacillus quenuiae TaxID=2008377 RepID=UPI000D012763|nr:ABC transporter permease [Apilactobacillus quenuiae]
MNNLFKHRFNAHLIEMTKYLKYVFNDFFVIALMFIFGGLLYEYSIAIKNLSAGTWWIQPLVLIILFISLQLGSLANFVKKADYVFLLPQEKSFYNYFKSAMKYSYVMASIIQVFVWLILIPLISKTFLNFNRSYIILLLISLLINKYIILGTSFIDIYSNFSNKRNLVFKIIFPIISLSIFIWASDVLSVVFSLIVLGYTILAMKKCTNLSVHWNKVINNENSRMHRIYQFFNMFTDVPMLGGKVKRRKYLDSLLRLFRNDNVFAYLFIRGMFRDKEISGLYTRLSLIGSLLILFINNKYLVILLSMLFIYLIVFQMIPYYFNFDENVFTYIYPISNKNKLSSFVNIINKLMYITIFLFFIVSIFSNDIYTTLILLLIDFVELFLLTHVYINKKIKKAELKS